jgi:hypothetical protein
LENTAVNDARPAESAWTRFWFTPIPTTGYHALRVCAGTLFCAWLLALAGHQAEFFSFRGFVDLSTMQELMRQRAEIARQQPDATDLPPLGWSFLYLAGDNAATFQAMYWGSIAVIALFTLGVATRITSVLTWVILVSFLANPIASYEGDYLLVILAFHLMLGYVWMGQWNGNLTIAERILGSRDDFLFAGRLWPRLNERPASIAANWSLRLLQIHFVIIMVTSGLHKLQIDDWWSGVALWYPLHPPFQTTLESIEREKSSVTSTLFALSLANYAVLAWQIGLPAFAWRRGAIARSVLLGGAAIGWLGMAFVYKLPVFGPFVFIGALSFLNPEEWAWVKERAAALFGRAGEGKAVRETAAVKK